jgi:hypothetical protein
MVQKESTISVKSITRKRLKKIGYQGQTYDHSINELLDLRGNKIGQAEEMRAQNQTDPSIRRRLWNEQ